MPLPPKWYQVSLSFLNVLLPLLIACPQFLVGVFASFGSILYGYDLGVIAEVIVS